MSYIRQLVDGVRANRPMEMSPVELSEQEISEPATEARKEPPLVGASIERSLANADRSVEVLEERLGVIETEIARLEREAANTRVVLSAHRQAADVLRSHSEPAAAPRMPRVAEVAI